VIRLHALAAAALLLAAPHVVAQSPAAADLLDEEGEPGTPRPDVSTRLVAVVGDDTLQMIGEMRVDLPWTLGPDRRSGDAFLAVFARTLIDGTVSRLTLTVPDLRYDVEAGWRGPGTRRRWSVSAGQNARELVDRDGGDWVRWIGAGIESASFRQWPTPRAGWAWRVQAGPVLDRLGIDADAVVRGSLRVAPSFDRPSIWRAWGLDLEIDGLVVDGGFDADVEIGPRLSLPFGRGRRAALIAHWLRARNPLGPRLDAVLVGVEIAEGSRAVGDSAPDLFGSVAAGAGANGRQAASFRIGLTTPTIGRHWRVGFDVDANALTAEDTGDLYYLYHLGLQREIGRLLVGGWYYHRSNHRLGEAAPAGEDPTSINVVEIGLDTDGWARPTRRRPGTLDARARAGWLIDSSFGERDHWHARGGLRWVLPAPVRHPVDIGVEAEVGDVERWIASTGISVGAGWEVRLERLRDDQLSSADRRAWLLLGRYGF